MPEGEVTPKKLNDSTIIQFNLKWFISIIVAIVAFFMTFYFTVQKPDNDSVKERMEELMAKEREYQDLKYEKMDELRLSVDDLTQQVEALNKRNRDLDILRARVDETTNTSGEL